VTLQDFFDSLKLGEFRLPVCTSCDARVWPPSNLCPNCFSPTSLKKIEPIGTLIEFADSHVKNKKGIFGIINIDGITLIAGLRTDKLLEGMKMRMAACGIHDDGTPFYEFEPYETGH
jgi:uncharacterized protein